ncbi:MAG: HAD family hydrolase [Spirochaetaceae bacterium]|nr:HAD family hydrolase [Spirochaetaceae bacterium]
MSADPPQALYVSDLDGTLLRSDGSLSAYSRRTLTRLIREGMLFTVASARGCNLIRAAIGDLPLRLPVINQNGACVSELVSRRHLAIHAIEPSVARDLWSLVEEHGCNPFLMTVDGASDRVYYDENVLHNEGMRRFLENRQRIRDPRLRRLGNMRDGLADQVVCLTVIGARSRVRNVECAVRARHDDSVQTHCYEPFNEGLDSRWHMLTIHDSRATKDQGVASLTRLLSIANCRVVVFGDQVNDIGMFRVADEAYAVAGAAPELAEHATAMIGSNDDDAVARWLERRWEVRRRH